MGVMVMRIDELQTLKKEQIIRACRRDFWVFCKVFSPILQSGLKMFRDEHSYLKHMAHEMQAMLTDDNTKILAISVPPRHCKSLMCKYFAVWYLANNRQNKIINASYSMRLVQEFSRQTKNFICEDMQTNTVSIKFSDVFPDMVMSRDNKSKGEWRLAEAEQVSYRATTFDSQVTGAGANLMVFDDFIKNSDFTEDSLRSLFATITDTFLSRIEGGVKGKILILCTRWSKYDPIALLSESSAYKDAIKTISYEAVDKDNKMLNSDLLDYKTYCQLRDIISEPIFLSNYHAKTVDMVGVLYDNLQFYKELPPNINKLKKVAVLDPAAAGKDFSACVTAWINAKEKAAYVSDIFYNNELLDEAKLVDFLINEGVEELVVEANGAFVYVVKNIKTAIKDKKSTIKVKEFSQTKNKEARILAASKQLQKSILLPEKVRLEKRYDKAYRALTEFKMQFKLNAHDDLPDAITLLFERYIADTFKKEFTITQRFL